jgi:hypothetical protein
MELAQEMSGGAPGSQAFLGALQDATTQLWKKVSIEEQERFAEIAQDWSENGPPKGIQAKSAIVCYFIHHLTYSSPQNGFSGYPRTDSPRLSNTIV